MDEEGADYVVKVIALLILFFAFVGQIYNCKKEVKEDINKEYGLVDFGIVKDRPDDHPWIYRGERRK